MALIKAKRGKTTYVYDVTYYNENGKEKRKWEILGKLDESGNLIPSKRRLASIASSEPKVEVNDKVPAIPLPAIPTIPEVIEAPICPPTDHLTESHDGLVTGEIITIVSEEASEMRNLPQVSSVSSKKTDSLKMGTTKLENILFDPNKNKKIYEVSDINNAKINVGRGNSRKKRIDTLLYIDFNNSKANGISIPYENYITPYDREIHNAVATLAAAGNQCITPSMIFQLLSGNISDTRNKIGEESRQKIVESLNKLIATRITINANAEVNAGMTVEGYYENYLIPAKKVEILINGQRVKDCIVLLDTLPLFAYASQKNQIATVKVKLLDTPLMNTPENIELKAYLLRRILSMSNKKNHMTDIIRYDTIYEYLQVTASTKDSLKHKCKQIRDKVKMLLEFWKKAELIDDYKEEKEGKSFAKVVIYFK